MSSRLKRNRKVKKDPWDENELMTSEESKLISLDLVKILAKPEAWNCLEEDEKKQILGLLPEDTHPNPDPPADNPDAKISPLPQEFLRYSNNWRGGVRQFQVDLECGRYDPEWLRQADTAVKERADGKYDAWKEKEFEEFWGQKQKLGRDAFAGEASQVKLETLVERGVFLKGDVWRYERGVYVTGEDGNKSTLLIEKEVKVVDIVGSTLTFAIPSGQRVIFPHHIEIPEEKIAAVAPQSQLPRSSTNGKTGRDEPSKKPPPKRETRSSKRRTSARQTGSRKRPQRGQKEDDEILEAAMPDQNDQELPQATEGSNSPVDSTNPVPVPVDNGAETTTKAENQDQAKDEIPIANSTELRESGNSKEDAAQSTETKADGNEQNQAPDENQPETPQKPTTLLPSTPASIDDIILIPNITKPTTLETHILAIDGRRKGMRTVNSWKAFRCYRNNQDIGNLWEVRQDWYLKHYT